MTKEVLMSRPTRSMIQTGVKRDPLSTKGGKVPTYPLIAGMKPPKGGSKPSGNGSGTKQ